jgi:hypothetical protein
MLAAQRDLDQVAKEALTRSGVTWEGARLPIRLRIVATDHQCLFVQLRLGVSLLHLDIAFC